MINRDIYEQDPKEFQLLNNGVAKLRDSHSQEELQTLRFELKTFICEGQYEEGLVRLLRSFVENIDNPEQPAAWISGFFGSGKSHLVKMLRYLWVNFTFPDGATARGLANLSPRVEHLLKELSTAGKRHGGLHAASGTLGSSAKGSVRLALLSIIFKSAGLPGRYPLAQFVMWLKREEMYTELRRRIEEEEGRDFDREIRNLTKSSVIARHLRDMNPTLGDDIAAVRQLLKAEHPRVDDVSLDEMVDAIHDALTLENAEFPCTLIALDEIQQYIGNDSQRTYDVQEATQACVSAFEGKLLFVATGQTALPGTPELEKLTGRYRIQIELSDADVETVTRKTVLKKKESARDDVDDVLTRNSGEISRHLSDTEFAPKPEDERHMVDDYPLLPTRRRFWERVLRSVDEAGTQSQLRTQLKVVDEAVKRTAEEELGTVVAGDFIFEDLRSDLLKSGVLSGDVDTRIQKLRTEEDDELGARLCALAFLIGKLPREGAADTGLRATPETFADLLVQDLRDGSSTLRNRVEERLADLEKRGILMRVEGEYRMQTKESQEWMNEFRGHYREIKKQRKKLSSLRSDALRRAANDALDDVRKIKQGKSNEPRSIDVHFSRERPATNGDKIPVWVRDEWRDTEASVEADARKEGTDSALIYVFLPKRSAEALDEAIATEKAAQTTLDVKGRTSTQEGDEARQAMMTRRDSAQNRKETALGDVMDGARVYLAGGQEYVDDSAAKAVRSAAMSALERLYPKFEVADDHRWGRVLRRALDGDASALDAVDYSGNPEDHPVCEAVLDHVGSATKGSAVRSAFAASPHGWPQDAVDAALALLTHTNHVRARRNGQEVGVDDLTQRTISTTRFRAETVQIGRRERIQIRKAVDGIVGNVEPNEELEAVDRCLDRMQGMADRLGGPPPFPKKPDVEFIKDVERHAGNEKLQAFYERKDTFLKAANRWQSMLNLRDRRKDEWNKLQDALRYADGLDAAEDVKREAEAIQDNRSLLDDDNPVRPLLKRLTQVLRNELRAREEQYEAIYQEQLDALTSSELWTQLDDDRRDQILAHYDLNEIPDVDTSDTDGVLSSLDQISLDNWEARIDALPQRFENALSEAAKALEPDTVRVRLPSRVLRSKDDAQEWLDKARERLLQQLEEGPVQV